MRLKNSTKNKNSGLIKTLDIISLSGVATLAFSAFALTLPATHADHIDPIGITLTSSCTMSGTISTPHSANLVPGVYTESIGSTTINTICNDVNGFSIYAIGYTDNTEGKTVLASSVDPSFDIATGTATSGNTSNWAMKLAAVSGTTTPSIYNNYNDYNSVPATYTKVAGYNGMTDPTNGASVTTTYALYTTTQQVTGAYAGQVKYIMVHPSTANGHTITFNPAGGTVSPTSEVVALGTSTTLPTPTRSGYKFLGWYTAPTGGTKIGDAGDTYTPTENTILHAQWQEQPSMQDFACNDIGIGDTVVLEDARDGNQYNIAKLADGKCWMLDNLAFNGKDNQGSGNYVTMDSSNTNISGSATWNDTIRTGWTSGSQNTYTASYINDASKNIVSSDAKDIAGNWKVGVYYNYCAATVNTICSSSTTTEASQDVCPKGWRLPVGGSSSSDTNEFQTLYSNSSYNTYDKYRDALHLPLSGGFNDGQPYNQASRGFWWSSTADSGTRRYYLYVNTSDINPADNDYRQNGYPIRCMAK